MGQETPSPHQVDFEHNKDWKTLVFGVWWLATMDIMTSKYIKMKHSTPACHYGSLPSALTF